MRRKNDKANEKPVILPEVLRLACLGELFDPHPRRVS